MAPKTKFATAVAAAILSVVMVSCGASAPAYAATARNPAIVKQFKEATVCPSTGHKATKGVASSYSCPGFVVDHGLPFCAGKYIGRDLDQVYNMSYQKYDKSNSLKKDADEKVLCDTLRKLMPAKADASTDTAD